MPILPFFWLSPFTSGFPFTADRQSMLVNGLLICRQSRVFLLVVNNCNVTGEGLSFAGLDDSDATEIQAVKQ